MSRLIEVEIFWDGDGYYYANAGSSDRLGGPFHKLHEAWKQADAEGLEVIHYKGTRGLRSYRAVSVERGDTTKKEQDFKKYMSGLEKRKKT
jgi:hypothetical protein